MNLMNEKIKAPIYRLSCISRITDAFADPDKSDSFFVDAQIFPGNSGRSVVNRPEVVSIGGAPINSNCGLIGVSSASVTYQELLYSKQTDRVRMIQEEDSGLTIVHPVDCIKEVVEMEWERHHKQIEKTETEQPAG